MNQIKIKMKKLEGNNFNLKKLVSDIVEFFKDHNFFINNVYQEIHRNKILSHLKKKFFDFKMKFQKKKS